MNFLNGITVLLVFQLLGELTVRLFYLPIPGPVVGMVYLLLVLLIRGSVDDSLEQTSSGLLNHLSLLFIPAGVGIMVYYQRILDEWLPIAVTLLLSTMITMALTAWLMFRLQKWAHNKQANTDE